MDQTKRTIYKARDPRGKLQVMVSPEPLTLAEAIEKFREKWPGQSFQIRYDDEDWQTVEPEG